MLFASDGSDGFGPQKDRMMVLPQQELPEERLIIDYVWWGDRYLWCVFWCEYNDTDGLREFRVYNDSGNVAGPVVSSD